MIAIDREQRGDRPDRASSPAPTPTGSRPASAASRRPTGPRCDLVNASFCAAVLRRRPAFPALWQRIVDSLRPGGRFCGQLFGDRDEWARTGLVVQTRGELEALLAPFEIEQLDEFEGDGPTVVGKPKHWHVFHVVARKR